MEIRPKYICRDELAALSYANHLNTKALSQNAETVTYLYIAKKEIYRDKNNEVYSDWVVWGHYYKPSDPSWVRTGLAEIPEIHPYSDRLLRKY